MATTKRRVLILSTGGTLGMRAAGGGELRPDHVLQDLSTWIPELTDFADIHSEIMCNIDSSHMTPEIWLQLARRIKKATVDRACEGVVILHGTDTLAFTASALSFLIPDLEMPVVLTGGQKPLAVTRTDARNNVLGAVETALYGPTEVMVFFNNAAFRGNRTQKVSIDAFDAFASPNYPALGEAGIAWVWQQGLFWPETRRPTIWPELPKQLPCAPWVLPWVPGLDFESFAPILENQWALILEAFGTGNLPVTEQILEILARYIEKGGLVVIRSQVTRGSASLETYAAGKVLADAGIHDGGDMTREAMVTKLMVLRGLGLTNPEIRARMSQSLVGEISETP